MQLDKHMIYEVVGATVSDFGFPWNLLAEIDFTLSEKSGCHFSLQNLRGIYRNLLEFSVLTSILTAWWKIITLKHETALENNILENNILEIVLENNI